jgi:uncharacterized ion transporter superfamily protein YfcC
MSQSNASDDSNSMHHSSELKRELAARAEEEKEVESNIKEEIKICVFLTSLASLFCLFGYSVIEYEFAEDNAAKRSYFFIMLVSVLLITILYIIGLQWPRAT